MSKRDDSNAAFYADHARIQLGGAPIRRKAADRLESHVPIRFRKETIDRVRSLAESDGLTVSSWIRTSVEKEVERRSAPTQATRLWNTPSWHWIRSENLPDAPQTTNEDWERSKEAQTS